MQRENAMDVLLVSTVGVQHAQHLLSDESQHPVDQHISLHSSLGVYVDRVEPALSQLVMDECEPKASRRGHRQWGCSWGFFRDDPPMKREDEPYAWDPDHAILTAVVLSRLVQPNIIGTEYAARVFGDATGLEVHPGPVTGPSATTYLHESIERRWLTSDDARSLAKLLAAYWPLKDALPPRISRAMWNHEYAAMTYDFGIRLVVVASALEALVHTDRRDATAQFCRLEHIAAELGLSLTEENARDAYDMRSEVAHGGRLVRLSLTGKYTNDYMGALLVTMEEMLRRAVRRAIEDATFRSVFEDDEHIRSRWPMPVRQGRARRSTAL